MWVIAYPPGTPNLPDGTLWMNSIEPTEDAAWRSILRGSDTRAGAMRPCDMGPGDAERLHARYEPIELAAIERHKREGFTAHRIKIVESDD